jgi:hypothetical protein
MPGVQDHYLAFIELENFGIAPEVKDEKLSVRQVAVFSPPKIKLGLTISAAK